MKLKVVSNISKYVGVIHLCGMIIENIYGFIFAKHVLCDKLYAVSFVVIPFSWVVCKDECIISYLIKKYENPHYILGTEPENVNDITDLFPSRISYELFYHTNHALRIASLIIVNNRTTHVSYFICIPTFLLYSFYIYDITYRFDYRKIMSPHFQIIFCMYLLSMVYNIYRS